MTLEEAKKLKKDLLGFDPEDENECLEAVKQDGLNLSFVHDPTERICLAAVKENGWALRYVKDQTPEICLAAVKQDGLALQFVKDLSMIVDE